MILQVELCQKLGEKYKTRPWSKYSKGSSAYKRLHPDEADQSENLTKPSKKKVINEALTQSILYSYPGN